MPDYTIVNYDGGKPLRCTMRQIGTVAPHTHMEMELDMVLTGRCQVTMGDERFTAGEDAVFSIPPHVPHSLVGADCCIITIQFEQTFFERTLPSPKHPDFICNSAVYGDSEAFHQMRRLIARLIKNNAEQQLGYELRNWSIIYEIMDVMYQEFRVDESEAKNQRAHRYSARMEQISRILNEQYQENMTLAALASQVHLSVPYLSKFFEKQFGLSFLSYLTRIRLNHAVELLLHTDATIEAVSADSGFPNSHAFVQAFKKEFGVLPSIYRRQHRQQPPKKIVSLQPEQHDYMAGLKKYLQDSPALSQPQAISTRGIIRTDANQGKLRHKWRTMLALTSAHAVLLSDVQQMLRRIQKDVGFTYVKFNGILSDEMHLYGENAAGKVQLSFAYVDKALDFLLSIRLKPFIQLGFMPEALSKENVHRFQYSISAPSSDEKWCRMIDQLIAHLQQRYGEAEVRSWLFCLWDQPDFAPERSAFADPAVFCAFYRLTRRIVKQRDSGIPFGAPATFYLPQENSWYLRFLNWCSEHDCLPDFLNFHYYDLVFNSVDTAQQTFGFQESMTLGVTPDGFQKFVTHVLGDRRKLHLEQLPIYLTEWNNTPSQQDLLNDTCFKSCYIVKGILENYDKLDSFAYWSLTDWMGEGSQPEQMFFGGLGMFTSDGIPKASYYAFTLLRQLGDTLLGKGEGWFATKQGGSYRILLYNYRHFSHLYALGERFDMTFTDRYTPFSPEQMLDVSLTLEGLPDGEYLISEKIVSRRSGSAFDQWVAMGAMELTTLEEQENLTCRSVPAINRYKASVQNGKLPIEALLDMLEVRLVTVELLS